MGRGAESEARAMHGSRGLWTSVSMGQSCRKSESELGDKVGARTRGAGVLAFLPLLVPMQRGN